MTDAEFYQAHKDDPEEWEDADGSRGRKPRRERLDSIISVRLTPDEEDALRAAAADRGLSLSAFVRGAALRDASPAVVHVFGIKTHTRVSNYEAQWSVDEHQVTGTGLIDVR